MAARKRSIGKRVHLSPHPGHSKKPGTHGKAPRKPRTTQAPLPSTIGHATKMPRWPMGRATTKRNQDPLPKR